MIQKITLLQKKFFNMDTAEVITLSIVALLVSAIVVSIGLYVRRHPEKMSGYNTMSRDRLSKIDLPRIGRFVSNMMFAAIPFMLASPFMPSVRLSMALLASPLFIATIAAVIYLNVFEKRFLK